MLESGESSLAQVTRDLRSLSRRVAFGIDPVHLGIVFLGQAGTRLSDAPGGVESTPVVVAVYQVRTGTSCYEALVRSVKRDSGLVSAFSSPDDKRYSSSWRFLHVQNHRRCCYSVLDSSGRL